MQVLARHVWDRLGLERADPAEGTVGADPFRAEEHAVAVGRHGRDRSHRRDIGRHVVLRSQQARLLAVHEGELERGGGLPGALG